MPDQLSTGPQLREPEVNTTFLLAQATAGLRRRIHDGVAAMGHPIRPAHAAVFINIDSEGTRLTQLADRAVMTPQAMGELVDDLVEWGYVTRVPDPTDRRAKLIMLTEAGRQCVSAGINSIGDIERRIDDALGVRRHRDLRRMLLKLLAQS